MGRSTAFIEVVAVAFIVGCGDSSRSTVSKESPKPATNADAPGVDEQKVRNPASDAFAVGTVFKGERTMGVSVHQSLKLVVTKRQGADFEGDLSIGPKGREPNITAKVTGKAPAGNGIVAFDTEKVGRFQQSFSGQYSDGRFEFELRGTTRNGNESKGKGVLTRNT